MRGGLSSMPMMAMTTGTMAAALALTFLSKDAVLDRGGAFTLAIDKNNIPDGARFTLDVYDLDHPVHPQGHVGWNEYDLPSLPDRLEGRLSLDQAGELQIEAGDLAPIDRWRNPDPVHPQRFMLIAALRTHDGRLLSTVRIPVLKSAADLRDFRSASAADHRSLRFAAPLQPIPAGRRIHIVAPNIFPRDAVGNLCLRLFEMLKQHGGKVKLFAENFDMSLNDIVEDRARLARMIQPGDVILYSFSTHDDGLPELLALKCSRKLAYFHGVTNPNLLETFDLELSDACATAIAQIPLLAGFDRLVANSAANASALRQVFAKAGMAFSGQIDSVPPQILGEDEIRLEAPVSQRPARAPMLLFVGRIVSHKRIEDLLALLAHYRKLDSSARCVIVGRSGPTAYRDHLRDVQRGLLLPDEAVTWRCDVTPAELAQLYDSAAAYVSMSEDEGFCMPVFEAMCHNVPVFAYDLPAVRETLGGSGIIFSEKNFDRLAHRLRDALSSPQAVQAILDAQHRRARDLAARMDGRYFLDLVAEA